MHEIAEFGVAAHWKYKEGEGGGDPTLDTRYEWVRDLLENPDSERATEFVAEFQTDLAGEEIYVFTPQGDLMTLPKGATPVDFAFRVHTQIGYHCNGAKVNDRVVPLSEELRSGDQVEIMTSKRKTPNAAWMQFVVTQKARSRIRHWLNEKRREFIRKGQEAWEKKAHRKRLTLSDHELQRIAVRMKFANSQELFYEIGKGLLDPTDVARMAQLMKERHEEKQAESVTDENVVRIAHERFLDEAQAVGEPALLIDGQKQTGIATRYATCCNPIPGDAVFGYLTRDGVIKIHRKTCVNSSHLFKNPDRIVSIEWTRQKDVQFMAALRIVGEDRVGMISDITDSISRGFKTNIRSISVESIDGVFEGSLVLDVKDLKHLKKVMQRLRRIKGVIGVYRFDEPRTAREQR
jgi:(p)ppGpp synthase/HD superfamily hydrolase